MNKTIDKNRLIASGWKVNKKHTRYTEYYKLGRYVLGCIRFKITLYKDNSYRIDSYDQANNSDLNHWFKNLSISDKKKLKRYLEMLPYLNK